jgi:hypothetical protein
MNKTEREWLAARSDANALDRAARILEARGPERAPFSLRVVIRLLRKFAANVRSQYEVGPDD